MTHKLLKEIMLASAGVLILTAGASAMPQTNKTIKTTVVRADQQAINNEIIVPKGYTADLLEDWSDDPTDSHVTHKLQRLSRQGMIDNHFYDNDPKDDRQIDLNNVSKSDQQELSHYALRLTNSIRIQMGLPKFTYSISAQNFANDVANEYNKDYHTGYEHHDISAINRVAKKHGLVNTGDNAYEELGGFDMTIGHQYASIKTIKQGIYYNIKQIAFGGFVYHNNQESDKENLNYYTEWYHANDLFTSDYTQDFALSLSYLAQDPNNGVQKVTSSHYIHVDPENIMSKTLYEK